MHFKGGKLRGHLQKAVPSQSPCSKNSAVLSLENSFSPPYLTPPYTLPYSHELFIFPLKTAVIVLVHCTLPAAVLIELAQVNHHCLNYYFPQ